MAKRNRRLSPEERAVWQEQRLGELPPGIPLDYFDDLCKRIDACEPWGCVGDRHTLSAAIEWVLGGTHADRQAEVFAWAETLGGICDCSILDRMARRVSRLFEGYEDAEGEHKRGW